MYLVSIVQLQVDYAPNIQLQELVVPVVAVLYYYISYSKHLFYLVLYQVQIVVQSTSFNSPKPSSVLWLREKPISILLGNEPIIIFLVLLSIAQIYSNILVQSCSLLVVIKQRSATSTIQLVLSNFLLAHRQQVVIGRI